MKRLVLFDLDGTLTDSSEGILASLSYMMNKLSLKIPDDTILASFIGPPLRDSLSTIYGMDNTEVEIAEKVYREYFAERGIHRLAVYPGIENLLNDLSSNYLLAIATSKPEIYAKQIVEQIGLTHYFTGIFGADLAGRRSKKADVIAYALNKLNTKEAVMVGDRKFDILGAKANELSSIGVLYGFGSQQELVNAKADIVVESVDELTDAIRKLIK
ncbi:HAD-IA family hydrolase [Enterococcus hermanniensis]|uniref:HAD hydrolase, family IA n=1 Tax=Enterococcus hermanniensis TaxID=249189 RepID=A0A1L8TN74_9ENTE|nr:HAD-IA family hydrolase [Enterococcus hermanniensis]OJG45785.1 HAD hydrolase, family IA [Enterococcus hermanniensis]